MKVVSIDKGKSERGRTVLTIVPEDKEDLFAMYQIIDIGDVVIFKNYTQTRVRTPTRRLSQT